MSIASRYITETRVKAALEHLDNWGGVYNTYSLEDEDKKEDKTWYQKAWEAIKKAVNWVIKFVKNVVYKVLNTISYGLETLIKKIGLYKGKVIAHPNDMRIIYMKDEVPAIAFSFRFMFKFTDYHQPTDELIEKYAANPERFTKITKEFADKVKGNHDFIDVEFSDVENGSIPRVKWIFKYEKSDEDQAGAATYVIDNPKMILEAFNGFSKEISKEEDRSKKITSDLEKLEKEIEAASKDGGKPGDEMINKRIIVQNMADYQSFKMKIYKRQFDALKRIGTAWANKSEYKEDDFK